MAGKSEDQMRKWAGKVMELASAERKRQEEYRAERAQRNERYSGSDRQYPQSSFAPPTPASDWPPFAFPPPLPSQSASGYFGAMEEEDDDSLSGFRSGRTTPSIGSSAAYYSQAPSRRVRSQQAMPADRQAELRARAMTEDQFGPSMTQWRSQQPPPVMPTLPRLTSAMSTMSTSSEASFGNNIPPRAVRQMSQSRLGRSEEVEEEDYSPVEPSYQRFAPARGMSRAPSQGVTPSVPYPHPPPLRSRSASSPNVYQQPKIISAPPMPNTAANGSWATGPTESLGTSSSSSLVRGTHYFTKRMSSGKRSSGESHSTETSETSSGQSPATPYGTIPGDSRGATPVSRQNSHDAVMQVSSMLIKVRCGEVSDYLHFIDKADMTQAQFIIGVPADINYATLHLKVLKKIRLCAASATTRNDMLQLKWVDPDEDEIAIKCDADIEMMFVETRDSGATCVNLIAR